MSASRETQHADLAGLDAPLLCVLAHHADGALCVLQRGFVGVALLPARDTIFQQYRIDANGIQPGGVHFSCVKVG